MNSLSAAPISNTEWLGLGQAARYLGVHPITLRRWADHGEIAVMLTPGGHRRFAMADLQRFSESRKQLRLTSGLEKSWADRALQRTRQEIVGQRREPWMAAFSETDRQKERELGQRLIGVMLQYVALAEGGDDLLQEAQTIGQAYAANALRLDLSLVEALQAMLFFRDTMVEAAVQMPEAARARPEANAHLVRRINRLLNAVQLSIAAVYEQQIR
jgi:excisionase family DNA binding protein